MKILRFFSVLVIVSVLMLSACSSNDTTKVTIYFAKDKHASLEQKLPLFDRLLNLFSSKAYAQHHVPANTDYYFLWVTADDIDGVYSPMIPGAESSVTIEVPSGNNRVFTLLSLHEAYYNYIGQKVIDLYGGDTAISIDMYPCSSGISIPPNTMATSITLTLNFDSTLATEGFSTYKLYRTCFGEDPTCGYSGNVIEVDPLDSNGPKEIFTSIYVDYYQLATTAPNQTYFYFLAIDSPYSPNGALPVPSNLMDYFSNYPFIAIYIMTSGQFTYSP